MRSIRWLAAVTGILALGTACGGDNGGGGVEPNEPPVANFTAPSCTAGVACQFTDASTDDNNNITGWAWNFGDNTGTSNLQNPSYTYTAAGTYNVSLTVTDGGGESSTPKVNTVTVAPAAPVNTPPVANFDAPVDCIAGTPCGFHSSSTDADGEITTTNWDFGDGNTGETPDATHTFADPGTYNVLLTVTDDDNATGNVTKSVTVAPPAAQDCITSGTLVDCTFTMTQRSTVKFVMGLESCDFSGNKLTTVSPVVQTIFFNLCNRRVGEETTIGVADDGTGTPRVFEAGQQLLVRFHQGAGDPEDPPAGDPGVRITGTFPNWTLEIDDGGNPTAPGEPDFNDAIVELEATLQ